MLDEIEYLTAVVKNQGGKYNPEVFHFRTDQLRRDYSEPKGTLTGEKRVMFVNAYKLAFLRA